MWQRDALRSLALVATLAALALGGCASQGTLDPSEWDSADMVGYRLLTKDDFQARSSSHVWGNVYHGAEICAVIVPAEDPAQEGAFRAVMNPTCSFWNRAVGPVGSLGGLAGASVIPGLPTPQPDWYVLQHEQIHFAIMEVAARQLSRDIAEILPAERTAAAVERAYRSTLARTDEQHERFDAATSGTFDPPKLDAWVHALETEMRRLCGREPRCWVRQHTPMGWGR